MRRPIILTLIALGPVGYFTVKQLDLEAPHRRMGLESDLG